jgi:hypothetical protein
MCPGESASMSPGCCSHQVLVTPSHMAQGSRDHVFVLDILVFLFTCLRLMRGRNGSTIPLAADAVSASLATFRLGLDGSTAIDD